MLEWVELDSEIKTAGLKNVSGRIYFTVPFVDCPHIGSSCPTGLVSPVFAIDSEGGLTNLDHRLVSGNMRHNWRTGKPIH